MSSPPFFNAFGGTTPYSTPSSNQQSDSSSSSGTTLNPSFLTVILVIAITIIISTSLCLLIRYLRTTRHFRRNSSSVNSTDVNNNVENTVSHRISSRRVLPESEEHLIESLPTFNFNSLSSRNGSLTGGDCAVCLSKFESDDVLRLLPICCHAFHAECVDTWIKSNQTCPLCRSSIFASEAEILSKVIASSGTANQSFRIEIGNVSRRREDVAVNTTELHRRSYSIGSFDYVVEDESQITVASLTRQQQHVRGLSETRFSDKDDSISVTSKPVSMEFSGPSLAAVAGEVGSGRSRLREYVDMLSERVSLSSRALSFRGSGRYFSGSSRRSVVDVTGDYDVEANRAGEEISEFFRWFSGV